MIRDASPPTDELSAPLGQNKSPKRRAALPIAIAPVIAGALGLCVATFAGWAMIANDPFGGEPLAVTAIAVRTDNAAVPSAEPNATQSGANERPNRYDGPSRENAQPVAPAPGSKTVTIIDGSSGQRQEVVIAGPADSKATADQRMLETSRHGLIPKIAQDGARPSDVFAHPVKAVTDKPNAPRIAIIVSGLGIGANGTRDALAKLPGPVTFAIAPYGADLEQVAARAQSAGHELLLQVPMEPHDYPDNDPGPQTLLTSLDPGQNVDRLHWLMSRFSGYVGLTNFMGGRFTASEQAFAPVLREAAKRGLIYVDDGGSPRSLASQIAGANNLAFAKANLVIDAVPTPADVDRALGRLETIARGRGAAIGIASALPVSIERIARWAKAAEGRGVVLVPISAAANKAKSS